MKKIILAALFTCMTFGVSAQEGFVSAEGQGYSQGGFKGPTPGAVSVAQAKTLRDDAWVVLEGNIIRQVGHELYEFKDTTGSIYVDIDDKRWMGQTLSPADKVRIEGEIDKDWNSVEIDVKTVRVLK
ncbi:YgiW/YdeI family stress tolerance OB fold protein [Pantoea sp. Bo_2]|uniref:YgiW/YdeI family stress tolerance OB fold protein n=1 Tax=unclassified Pantoea TaxID=2630326 RepID=UPI0012319271|nr:MULTISPECIES: YgiW/YdeI family stress tolerance OB fold protein [unclassified Pantoea]KAA5940168.1 YgiW/YdeI family stress tolerance OB fold protein [Pantoea sp. VH_3]KAA5948892.1 YgiW/YdeI family stress tolerance OB fold protein [Pantoea sp. VH_25]KAA5952967.1 YgiW/YdeI family stress tolerance OB fold protein [Pantoea sp. VH_24]KAA5956722.1 YgiW/YdeI family stress tolerance OB fold protein [Pantoea sp. VH_16]KAA5962770.1 YgiW/YdeI family stress tolerance OB fold protein [Pantoea sp. VH_18]